MLFYEDSRLAEEAGRAFGEYLISFKSGNSQVSAHLFKKGRIVTAHVSFPTGLDGGSVTDPYLSSLWDYAREHGFADEFRLVYS